MSEQTTPEIQPEKPVVPVQAEVHPRLAQLHAAYDEAAAAYDAANSHFEAIKAGIKAELTALVPDGTERIALSGQHGPTLSLTYSESWRIDSRKLKREDPETYVRYAKKGGSWTLRTVTGGSGDE